VPLYFQAGSATKELSVEVTPRVETDSEVLKSTENNETLEEKQSISAKKPDQVTAVMTQKYEMLSCRRDKLP